jgi:hypothetical protein
MPTLLEPVAVEASLPRLDIDAQRYLGLAAAPRRILDPLDIAVSPRAFAPRLAVLRSEPE